MRPLPSPPEAAGAGPSSPFFSRIERFASVDSTQRVVREWLDAGADEVAVAVARHQTAGRGRLDRTWHAPIGGGLLVSLGFRPRALPARHGWRLAAVVALAMLDGAEAAAGLRDGTLWLKWPNDIVANEGGAIVKVAGVLGETTAAGERVDTAVVGIGVNSDWPAELFPADLAGSMSSLRELAGGRPVDNEALLDEFLARLEPRYGALIEGHFDAGGWSTRQITTGRAVEVATADASFSALAVEVDPDSGALLVERDEQRTSIGTGEVVRVRIAGRP